MRCAPPCFSSASLSASHSPAISSPMCLTGSCCAQANFEKYSSGGGFVSSELAAKIVSAGPHLEHSNGSALKAARYSVEL